MIPTDSNQIDTAQVFDTSRSPEGSTGQLYTIDPLAWRECFDSGGKYLSAFGARSRFDIREISANDITAARYQLTGVDDITTLSFDSLGGAKAYAQDSQNQSLFPYISPASPPTPATAGGALPPEVSAMLDDIMPLKCNADPAELEAENKAIDEAIAAGRSRPMNGEDFGECEFGIAEATRIVGLLDKLPEGEVPPPPERFGFPTEGEDRITVSYRRLLWVISQRDAFADYITKSFRPSPSAPGPALPRQDEELSKSVKLIDADVLTEATKIAGFDKAEADWWSFYTAKAGSKTPGYSATRKLAATVVALSADAARWRALVRPESRVRVLGTSFQPANGYFHIGVEFWSAYPGARDEGGREALTTYADGVAALAAHHQSEGGASTAPEQTESEAGNGDT